MTKRHKIITVTILLILVMGGVFWFGIGSVGLVIALISAYIGSVWALGADFKKEEWIIMPLYILLVTSAAFSWLTLYSSSSWLLILGTLIYGVAIYTLLLTLNILNIATAKPIPLARTANSVLAMTGLGCSFSLFYLALVNQPGIVGWVSSVAILSILLAWPLIWFSLSDKQKVIPSLLWSLLCGLLMAQLALLISFWPSSFMTSLLLAGILSIVVGIIYHLQRRNLTKQIQQQYYLLGAGLLIGLYVVTIWT